MPSDATTTTITSFANSALALVDEVDGVAEAVTVKDVVSERLRWDAPWFWVRAAHEEDLERLCRPVFGDFLLPHARRLPHRSARIDRCATAHRAGLNVKRPPLLVVGGPINSRERRRANCFWNDWSPSASTRP